MIKNTALLALSAALLTGCGPNKIIVDLPSPQGQYHVEVRKCPQPGSMSSAEQTQVSILKSGISENCQSAVNALAQFQSYSPDEQLQLEWLSEADFGLGIPDLIRSPALRRLRTRRITRSR